MSRLATSARTPARASHLTWMSGTAVAVLVAVVAGCGGGGSGSGPSVSNLQATTVAYGRTMFVSISGQGLDQGLALEVDKVCTNVTQVAGGSETSQSFSCRVGAIGEYNLSVRASSGARLASLKVNVPLPQVTLTTSKGTLVVELDPVKAPVTVDNFLAYVNDSPSFYRNVIFHRVEKNFVIQAGGYRTGLTPITAVKAPITLESQNGLSNLRGTIGMAREVQSAGSATSQFYVNLKDNLELDYKAPDQPGFAVFGRVVTGMDVADAIGEEPVRNDLAQGLANVPVTEVVITAASQTK